MILEILLHSQFLIYIYFLGGVDGFSFILIVIVTELYAFVNIHKTLH